ncbi:MAG: hypothetical protein LBU79_08295 [Planctomycetota bacterium]|jgi:hypothetical protein|nr:hypothetical protein [Planctomycetota bacterium]
MPLQAKSRSSGNRHGFYLLEAIFFASIFVVGDYLLNFTLLVQSNPSPLWLIVLLGSLRHGSPAGMVAGLVSAAAHVLILGFTGIPVQDIIHRDPKLLAGPVLYVLVGLFVGESRERLGKRADYLSEVVGDLSRQLDSSEIKRMGLERSRLELEKRIAGQTDTLKAVHTSLDKLSGAGSETELWERTVELVCRELLAKSCIVWRISPPEILASNGSTTPEIPPLAYVAIRKRRVVTASDWNPRPGQPSPGAELAGVISSDSKNLTVMVASGIPFNRLTRNTAILFGLMAQRAGDLANELRHLDQLRLATVNDPELGMMSESYLRSRIREQCLLYRRHGGTLSVVACKNRHHNERQLEERLSVVVACAIRAVIRSSDGVAFFAQENAFVMMLPGSPKVGGQAVVNKVEGYLNRLDLRDGGGHKVINNEWRVAEFDPKLGDEALYPQLFPESAAGRETA